MSDENFNKILTLAEKLLSTSLPLEPRDTLMKYEIELPWNPKGGFSWYDFLADEWVLLPKKEPENKALFTRFSYGFGFLPLGNKVYRMGGEQPEEKPKGVYFRRWHGGIEVLDLINDREWSPLASEARLPMRLYEKQPVELNGSFYYYSTKDNCGGFVNQYYRTTNTDNVIRGSWPFNYLNCYSIQTRRWSEPIPIPESLNEFVLDLYALSDSLYLNVSYKNGLRTDSGTWAPHRYTPTTGQWSALTGWPKGIADMLAHEGKFYAQTGKGDYKPAGRHTLHVYCLETELWNDLKYPANVKCFAKFFSVHGQLCGLHKNDLYEFKEDTGSWRKVFTGKNLDGERMMNDSEVFNVPRMFVAKTMEHHHGRNSMEKSTSGAGSKKVAN